MRIAGVRRPKTTMIGILVTKIERSQLETLSTETGRTMSDRVRFLVAREVATLSIGGKPLSAPPPLPTCLPVEKESA